MHIVKRLSYAVETVWENIVNILSLATFVFFPLMMIGLFFLTSMNFSVTQEIIADEVRQAVHEYKAEHGSIVTGKLENHSIACESLQPRLSISAERLHGFEIVSDETKVDAFSVEHDDSFDALWHVFKLQYPVSYIWFLVCFHVFALIFILAFVGYVRA